MMDINFLALKPGVGYLNLLPDLLSGLWQIAQEKFVGDSFMHPAEQINGLYLRLGREHPVYDAIGKDVLLKRHPYAWYVRIPDEVSYLLEIKPQLEQHLSGSTAAGYDGLLRLNFYNRGVELKFQDGKLKINEWTPMDGTSGDAHFPANSFWSILCGQKSAVQLNNEIADCWMSRNARVLLDCLFPQFNGQIWVLGGGG
jgi:hypothetical protein